MSETTMRVDDDLRDAIGRAAELIRATLAFRDAWDRRDDVAGDTAIPDLALAEAAITDADLALLAAVAEGGER